MFGSRSLEQKLREGNGKSALATVLTYERTFSSFTNTRKVNNIGGSMKLHFSLNVEPDGEEPFEAEVVVDPLAIDAVQSTEIGRLRPGKTVGVLYDPTDHSKVVFDSVKVAAGYAETLEEAQRARAQGLNAKIGGVWVNVGAQAPAASAPEVEVANIAAPPPPPPSVPPGWYPDANNAHLQRYWDGTVWTENTAPLL
jgi:hypothetical protein